MDPNAALIEPQKSKREEALPPWCVLIFTSQDLDLFLRCFPQPPRRTHKIFLANVYTGVYDGVPVALAGPMMGAPQAVMVLEKLIALGVRQVVGVGWCGSLQPHVRIGDLILPRGSVCEEGTSAHYPVDRENPGSSAELLAPLREALQAGRFTIHEGRVWSTDAPYRETIGKIQTYQEQGILGVEMEASALFTVACYRAIRLAMVLIVSDELFSLKWTHGFREEKFQHSREKLSDVTLKVICASVGSLLD